MKLGARLTRHRPWAAFAALTATVLLAGACGSSSSSSGSATIPTASKDSSAAAKVPSSISARGTVTVAMDATYPPDEFLAADGHTITGMDVDLLNAIGQVLGLRPNMVAATFNTIIPGLLSNKFDIGASSFTDTKDREKQLDFVTYFTAGEGFYELSNSKKTFNGLNSICGHKVSVESGTTEESDAQNQSKTCQSSGKPPVTVLSFQDQNGANLAVSSGRAEVGFADSQVAAYQVEQSHGQFKLTGTPFANAPYGMAPAILAALKDLMKDGIYTKILKKWGIEQGAITDPVINGATS